MFYFVGALILTLLIEVPIVTKLLQGNSKNTLITAFGVNLLTNPVLNFLAIYAQHIDRTLNINQVLLLEIVIIFIEAAIYHKKLHINDKRAIYVSTIANVISLLCGNTLMEVLTYI